MQKGIEGEIFTGKFSAMTETGQVKVKQSLKFIE